MLEAAGLTEGDIDDIPVFQSSNLKPPPIIIPTTDFNWPSVSTGENFFDRALAEGKLEGGVEPSYVNGDAPGVAASSALDAWAQEEAHDELDPAEEGWELDADATDDFRADGVVDDAAGEDDEELGAGAAPGINETELWVRNSPLVADHVAAGSFESAMQVRKIGNGLPDIILMCCSSFLIVNSESSILLC